MDKKINVDFIIEALKVKVENKEAQFDANFFIETAAKLNLLLGDEADKLFDLKQKVAQLKIIWLDGQEKRNVSECKLRVEASEEFKEMLRQEAKVKRCEQFIMIAKKMSDVARGL